MIGAFQSESGIHPKCFPLVQPQNLIPGCRAKEMHARPMNVGANNKVERVEQSKTTNIYERLVELN